MHKENARGIIMDTVNANYNQFLLYRFIPLFKTLSTITDTNIKRSTLPCASQLSADDQWHFSTDHENQNNIVFYKRSHKNGK